MPKGSAILAFDFGASSGRCIAGRIEDGRISTEVIHRFPNRPVFCNGRFQWDSMGLFREIIEGLIIFKRNYDEQILSLGIDTWGVDYGLLSSQGRLLANPYHYRDSRTDTVAEKLFAVVPRKELYAASGIQFMSINTVFQLFAERLENPELFDQAATMALTPDLFNYFLTDTKRSELSIASTTAMVNPRTKEWNWDLIDTLGYPERLFSPIIRPGEVVGRISSDIESTTGHRGIQVMAAASHDTQSAIAAVPAVDDDFIYLSSGTWSLMGVESSQPVLSEQAEKFSFTNEIGVNDKISLLTNIMGLWLIQECKRIWDLEGRSFSFAELAAAAEKAPPFQGMIDPMDPCYSAPRDMTQTIRENCTKAGFAPPETEAGMARLIFESLALTYRRTAERITELTGRDYRVIHVVGGGVQNRLLCRMTADATGRRVIAGPTEATALGNIMIQAAGHGLVGSIAEGRRMIADSTSPEHFEPQNTADWDRAYRQFQELFPG